MREFIVAGNWKMYKSPQEAEKFVEEFLSLCPKEVQKNFVLFPSTICLPSLRKALSGQGVRFGAQNCHFELEGAFTGENSPRTLKDFGCHFVLLGHSERRQYFAESDEALAKKVKTTQALGLQPMLCVGETLQQRQAGETFSVLEKQLSVGLSLHTSAAPLTIAYEPVWAIGTGQVATPEQAQEAHVHIRKTLKTLIGTTEVSILYGGSVKPDNAAELSQKMDIDGFLIGGASLKPLDFWTIGEKAKAHRF